MCNINVMCLLANSNILLCISINVCMCGIHGCVAREINMLNDNVLIVMYMREEHVRWSNV